jgi:acyl dehydratase
VTKADHAAGRDQRRLADPPTDERLLVEVTAPIDRTALKRYAEASLDFNPMHIDDDAAREVGEPAAIAHGMLTLSIVVERVLAAFPRGGRASRVEVRFGRKLDVDRPVHVWLKVNGWTESPQARVAHTNISGEDEDGNAYVNGEMDVTFAA